MTNAPPIAVPASWRDPRHRFGLAGELEAIRYLETLGWTLEAHRFRLGHHDIDLVVRRGTMVAFVEVKSRRSCRFGMGVEAIGWRKRRDLTRTASVWVMRFGRASDVYRFDVLVIQAGGSRALIHIEDAWRGVEK
ncbi:MAG: YraN family protein [Gemmatimonadota bacterium]